jgi:hypothetical protein
MGRVYDGPGNWRDNMRDSMRGGLDIIYDIGDFPVETKVRLFWLSHWLRFLTPATKERDFRAYLEYI